MIFINHNWYYFRLNNSRGFYVRSNVRSNSSRTKNGDPVFSLPTPTHPATRLFFQIASYLSESICQVRELYFSLWTIDELYKDEHKALRVFRKCLNVVGMLLCAIVTPITAPVGMALRAATAAAQTTPFIYSRDTKHAQPVPNPQAPSLLSWNVCCVPGGYEVTSSTPRGGLSQLFSQHWRTCCRPQFWNSCGESL